ncbi:MAG: hypothetical protein E6X34_04550 [Clostridium sp.]|uniref:hypothetical protein n=1 Tax=Clostridium sp. TaxID=1506 RepID=UPI002912A894|nr:hypothetical protein [Clostridium sp.]MDU4937713.1 hypothetical protein [Clostridium sp.]
MNQYKYHVQMMFPLGKREGTIVINDNNGQLNGILSLLGNNEEFTGVLKQDRCCEIRGKIVSLTKTIIYYAVGEMHSKWIKLDFFSNEKLFHMEGVREE